MLGPLLLWLVLHSSSGQWKFRTMLTYFELQFRLEVCWNLFHRRMILYLTWAKHVSFWFNKKKNNFYSSLYFNWIKKFKCFGFVQSRFVISIFCFIYYVECNVKNLELKNTKFQKMKNRNLNGFRSISSRNQSTDSLSQISGRQKWLSYYRTCLISLIDSLLLSLSLCLFLYSNWLK